MVRRVKKVKKPAARIVRLARKYKVKISVKRGSKRVYKPAKLLLKQIKRKMRSTKTRKVRKTRRVRRVRRSRFGKMLASEYIKNVPN